MLFINTAYPPKPLHPPLPQLLLTPNYATLTLMASAPTHYIRTIHTPFTAASSSAWASASRGSQTLNHHHHNHLSNITALNNLGHPLQGQFAYARTERDQPNYSPSINSHNSHFYTQHLQSLSYATPHHHHHNSNNVHQLSNGQYVSISPKVAGLRKNAVSGLTTTSTASHGPSGAGGGRRRSASIRVPPPSFVPTHAPPPQTYKFDPFGDEPLSSGASDAAETSVMPLSSGSQANRVLSSEDTAEPEVRKGNAPYTIHIPPAQPIEIQRYSPPRSPRPASRTLTPKAAALISFGPISPPRSSPPPADVIVPRQQTSGGPNLSKIVAGILLNRVHAVGKPMKRKVLPKGQGYRKSCLSSVVSVEA